MFLNYGYSHASELLLYSLLQQDSKNLGFKIYKEWLPHLFYILVPPQHIKAELKKMKSWFTSDLDGYSFLSVLTHESQFTKSNVSQGPF